MILINKYKIIFIITAVVLSIFVCNLYAKADWLSNPLGAAKPSDGITKVETGIKKVVDLIITVAEIAFIILLLIGGVMYLTSMGNEEQAGKARKLIIEAIVGLVIVLAAWAISTWIIGNLKGSGGIFIPKLIYKINYIK